MPERWDPRAKPPSREKDDSLSLDISVEGALNYMQWLHADLTAFQREHPEVPQGDVSHLPKRKYTQVYRDWERARQVAELEDAEKKSPEWAAIVERFHRTGILSSVPPRRRKKTNHFYVTSDKLAFEAIAAAQSGTAITISGIVGDKVQEFTGVVKSAKRVSPFGERWKIAMREAK
jgi:hypothetical protein